MALDSLHYLFSEYMKSPFKPWLIFIMAIVTASVAAVFFFMADGPQTGLTNKPSQNTAANSTSSPARLSEAAASPLTSNEASGELGNKGLTAASAKLPIAKPEILESIHEAAISYSAEELPKIQPFLLHSDPEVRAAALQGMITLGDAAAAPLLRNAAQLAISPEEATALRQAADYVELPSGSLITPRTK